MKKWLPVVILALLTFEAGAFPFGPKKPPALTDSIGIISDVDDTVRPTGTLHPARALEVATGIKKVKAFAGMQELYRELLSRNSNSTSDLIFVSGAPVFLSEDLRPYLRETDFDFQDTNVHVNNGSPIVGVGKYKQGQFKNILTANPATSFYFFGDDTQKDPDSIAFAKKSFPKQIAGAYIHTIEGHACAFPSTLATAKSHQLCPAGEVPYYTSVEIALHELKLGHLSAEQVAMVAQAMVNAADYTENVIPKYAALCPKAGWIDQLMTELGYLPVPATGDPLIGDLREQLKRIQDRVEAVCTADRVPEADASPGAQGAP